MSAEANAAARSAPAPEQPIDPATLPTDHELPTLHQHFDTEWVWSEYCANFGEPEKTPERLRVNYFSYRPGARAVIGYVGEWSWDQWLVEDQFAFELRAGQLDRLFRYPEDPYLPGLAHVADPLIAQDTIADHVPLHPQRLRLDAVRYRPTTRAVLRHHVSWRRKNVGSVTLYARVMAPDSMKRFVTAGELADQSGFALPRLVGYWPEGGVAWLAKMPGKTVRRLIRDGEAPDPEQILDGLAPLWAAPIPDDAGEPEDPSAVLRRIRRILAQVLPGGEQHRLLRRAVKLLRPFAEAWQPTALAHNDFYDDQMLVTPEGRIGLVDFEETAPGDPLLDVGNMLAHLSWMSRFSSEGDKFAAYRRELRPAALRRFRWQERDLALREAFSLFRLCTIPIRRFRKDRVAEVDSTLEMVVGLLDGGP